MSSVFNDTAPQRFFRPSDATRVRRNLRRIQLQRLAAFARNLAFVIVAAALAFWAWRRTQSDTRFAVRHIEIAGAVHTSRPAVEAIASGYSGANLFKIDIARVQRELGSLAWVERIAIEKKIPDTLRINVIERTPVALLLRGRSLEYVDAKGVVLDRLSPAIGDADLPIVTAAGGAELVRTVQFLVAMKKDDPIVYSRIAEIRPVAPGGFAVFDRDLAATVYASETDASSKWRSLYAIARAEGLQKHAIEYADLRFADRVVVRPLHPDTVSQPRAAMQAIHARITN